MKYLLLVLILLPGCKYFDPKYAPEAELAGHTAACNASTANLIARAKARGDACPAIVAAVGELWRTDVDCLYYGVADAGTLECHQ